MGHVTRLSAKFQISIPKDVRDAQGWKAGQEFAFVPDGKGVLLVPVPNVDALFGVMKGANPQNYRDRDDRY